MNKGSSKIKGFSAMRGILWLLPLICMFGVLIYQPNQKTEIITADLQDSSKIKPKKSKPQYYTNNKKEKSPTKRLFKFDPNTVNYKELRVLGLTKNQCISIIKYRESGKVFKIKEDLVSCYGVTDSIYFQLEPYIIIGDKYKIKKIAYKEETKQISEVIATKKDSLFIFDPNTITEKEFMMLGFSPAQTKTFLKYRDMVGSFASVDKFLKCYSVTDRSDELRPYVSIKPIPKLEINGADSIELCKINGIGYISAKAIIDYRTKLGGFVKIEQLYEIKQITERNFEKIYRQIYVDSIAITKIDVNFASSEQLVISLLAHPYAGRLVVRKLLKQRQLKGGWSTIGELMEEDILTTVQAERLAPYLRFRVPNKN